MADINAILGEVEGKLTGLSTEKIVALVQKLDLIANLPGVDALRDQARPLIRTLRPPRSLQFKRLVCVPFEDLLVPAPSTTRDDRIPRAAIQPFWDIVERMHINDIRDLTAELAVCSLGDDDEIAAILLRGAAMALSAMDALLDAPGGPGQPGGLVATHWSALQMIRASLAAAEEIEAFKRLKPAIPLRKFDTEAAAHVSAAIKILAKKKRRIDGYLQVIAARLEFPTELSTHLATVERIELGLDGAATDAAQRIVNHAAVQTLKERLQNFERGGGGGDPMSCASEVDRMVRMLESGREHRDPKSRKEFDSRAQEVAEIARGALSEMVIDPAITVICAALPAPGTPSDMKRMAAAEAHAAALAQARYAAGKLGLTAAHHQAQNKICERYAEQARALGLQMTYAAPDPTRQRQLSLTQAVRMVELLSGSAEAVALMRQVRAPRG